MIEQVSTTCLREVAWIMEEEGGGSLDGVRLKIVRGGREWRERKEERESDMGRPMLPW